MEIRLPFKINRPVLALGSQTKNTVCFVSGNTAYLSCVHTDLSNPDNFLDFERDVRRFLKKKPRIIAYDLHLEYQSTKYALSALHIIRYTLRSVQHHHAHIASCMADNGLKNQRVIGVAFDGTGLGDDNTLWGAEFFICNYSDYKRVAHLKEIPLLGGEGAILEPWRLAVMWLYMLYQDRLFNLDIEFVRRIDKRRWRLLYDMYRKNFNAPLASSIGRLFDAAASIILKKYKVNFEAEAAIELEKTAGNYKLEVISYKFNIKKMQNVYIIDPTLLFKEIIADIQNKAAPEKMALRFHLTVAKMIGTVCRKLRWDTGINMVVLSGGVFQNNLLLHLTLDLLYKDKFKALIHREISCNDSGISLGQAVIGGRRT